MQQQNGVGEVESAWHCIAEAVAHQAGRKSLLKEKKKRRERAGNREEHDGGDRGPAGFLSSVGWS